MTRRFLLLCGTLLLAVAPPARAGGEACAQAREIVAEVAALAAGGAPDHAALLAKLKTARNLCPTLGEAWKLSYCSALALGQTREAQIFRDRAVFASVKDLSCSPGEAAKAAPPAPLPSFVRDKYALIVGIGTYKDEPRISRLQFAAKDARDLAGVLTDPRYGRFKPDHVRVLTDQQATRAGILEALQELSLKVQENDLVLIYVSGHGSPHQDDSGLKGVGYIITHDTLWSKLYVDALDYEGFARLVSLLKARRKVVFLDTCFSGLASRKGEKALSIDGGVDARTARLFLSGEGTFVVTSSQADETSFESETLENSFFTYHLMSALRRPGDPPTLKEVFGVLSRDVPSAVLREKGMPQHPQILPIEGPQDLRIGVASQQ